MSLRAVASDPLSEMRSFSEESSLLEVSSLRNSLMVASGGCERR